MAFAFVNRTDLLYRSHMPQSTHTPMYCYQVTGFVDNSVRSLHITISACLNLSVNCRDISFLREVIRDHLNSFFHLAVSGLDVQLWIERWLVWRRNSCKP